MLFEKRESEHKTFHVIKKFTHWIVIVFKKKIMFVAIKTERKKAFPRLQFKKKKINRSNNCVKQFYIVKERVPTIPKRLMYPPSHQ